MPRVLVAEAPLPEVEGCRLVVERGSHRHLLVTTRLARIPRATIPHTRTLLRLIHPAKLHVTTVAEAITEERGTVAATGSLALSETTCPAVRGRAHPVAVGDGLSR